MAQYFEFVDLARIDSLAFMRYRWCFVKMMAHYLERVGGFVSSL
jgi:hypothetical protein